MVLVTRAARGSKTVTRKLSTDYVNFPRYRLVEFNAIRVSLIREMILVRLWILIYSMFEPFRNENKENVQFRGPYCSIVYCIRIVGNAPFINSVYQSLRANNLGFITWTGERSLISSTFCRYSCKIHFREMLSFFCRVFAEQVRSLFRSIDLLHLAFDIF